MVCQPSQPKFPNFKTMKIFQLTIYDIKTTQIKWQAPYSFNDTNKNQVIQQIFNDIVDFCGRSKDFATRVVEI